MRSASTIIGRTVSLLFFLTTSNRVLLATSFNNNFIMSDDPRDNPDLYLSATKIIRRHGYPVEAHEIETEDGYLLEAHRIPHGKVKSSVKKETPILLQHGILCTSVDWLINGPEKSLGYLLADRGYDVWLSNMRGNKYSKGHVRTNPKRNDFWNFSFHESGYYDLPAVIDYVLRATNSEQLIYIGYSMGTTIFYVMCATRPEYNSKVKLHVGLAPVASITYTRSLIKHFIPTARVAKTLMDTINAGAILEQDVFIKIGTTVLCSHEYFYTHSCFNLILEAMFGSNPKGRNKATAPMMISHSPAGTSVKTLVHFAQLYNEDKFQQYNYGVEGNRVMYNQSTPPRYDLSKVTVPAALYYGANDLLSDSKDVRLLYHKLPCPVELTKVDDPLFNHLDFISNIDINSHLNDHVLLLIEKSEKPHYLEERVAAALRERWEAAKIYPWFAKVVGNNYNSNVFNNKTDVNNNNTQRNNVGVLTLGEDPAVAATGQDQDDVNRTFLQRRVSNRSMQAIHGEYRKNNQMVTVR